jgi:hypothetical protein
MADPIENAPLPMIDKTGFGDTWIFRAISPLENVIEVHGNTTYARAYKDAQKLQARGFIVEIPYEKHKRTWRAP